MLIPAVSANQHGWNLGKPQSLTNSKNKGTYVEAWSKALHVGPKHTSMISSVQA